MVVLRKMRLLATPAGATRLAAQRLLMLSIPRTDWFGMRIPSWKGMAAACASRPDQWSLRNCRLNELSTMRVITPAALIDRLSMSIRLYSVDECPASTWLFTGGAILGTHSKKTPSFMPLPIFSSTPVRHAIEK